MNDNQPTAPQTQPMPTPHEDHVGFPAPHGGEKKGGLVKWIVAGVGVIAIIVVGAVFLLRPPAETETQTQTESGNVLQAVATPEVTETPEPTPSPEPIEKSEIAIEILNGTGTPGDAGLAQDALEAIDFEDMTAANADEQEETETTLTYSSEIPQQIVDEIEAALEPIFGTIRVRRGTVGADYDVRILTGPKADSDSADATATPAATESPDESDTTEE